MKKTALCATLLVALSLSANAQQVRHDDLHNLQLRYETPAPTFSSRALDGQKYAALTLPGYTLGGDPGSPALPVLSHYIATPFCGNIRVSVENAVYDTLHLSDANFQLYPMQPARSKRDTVHPVAFDRERYSTDDFYSLPLASVQPLGLERDRNLALLSFSPVSVNPVSGQIIVCRSADVTVSFEGADVDRTLDHYLRLHTPAFASTRTLNAPFAKVTPGQAPVRIAIVAGAIPGIRNSHGLKRFVQWKRTQGYLVDVIYTDSLASATTTDIYDALKQLYLSASSTVPAPAYVILVGDHDQLPSYNSNLSSGNFLSSWPYYLSDHITDHYYTTWTDDNLRDCYLGRFSATDTTQLNNIINKTLLYERYQFADDSYLGRAVLIAGVDSYSSSDEAYRCADPTMDYIARYYATAANGYNDVTYYKNNTNFHPDGVTVTGSSHETATATALRALYNEGIGWINYSAHGEENGWSIPSFKNNHVAQMTNNGKPSFMIGNCCLSNHFNTAACFGETLLRKDNNAGAIGYIGGTNSSFWDADFYFSVGVRDNVNNTMNTSYSASNLGSYDRLFHTHGESFTSHAVTAGAMVHAGLMAVNSRNTNTMERDMIEYYWEIYELMGDPTLMPWLGRAADNDFSASISGTSITVETAPYAYVALVDHDLSLIAAAFAGSGGSAVLTIPAERDLSRSFFSITAQNRKPLTRDYTNSNVAGIESAATFSTLAPNPAIDRCTIQAVGLQRVQLLDLMGRIILDQPCAESATLNLDGIEAGIYLVRSHTANGVGINKLVITK